MVTTVHVYVLITSIYRMQAAGKCIFELMVCRFTHVQIPIKRIVLEC